MKFGKQIQRQQLELPEYAASFLNYKALKKLIKQLSATPTIPAQGSSATQEVIDPKVALRANKEVFFFRLVSMLDCVLRLAADLLPGARNRRRQCVLPPKRGRVLAASQDVA
jgi:SPX domain protein involved in polyphosphate accumulation